jgi:hypothetical protein
VTNRIVKARSTGSVKSSRETTQLRNAQILAPARLPGDAKIGREADELQQAEPRRQTGAFLGRRLDAAGDLRHANLADEEKAGKFGCHWLRSMADEGRLKSEDSTTPPSGGAKQSRA